MLSAILLIHGASPETDDTAYRRQGHAGRNHEIVGRERRSGGVVVGIRHQHTIRIAKAHTACQRQLPVVAVAVGIDEGPVEDAAFLEVLFKVPRVGSVGGIITWRMVNHIARGRYIVFNALLGLRSKRGGH